MPSAIAHTSILQPLRKSTSKRAAAIPSSGAQGLGKPENRVSRTAPMPQARESCFYSPVREKKRVPPPGWQTARPDSRFPPARRAAQAFSASRFQKPKPRILFPQAPQARGGALCSAPSWRASERQCHPAISLRPNSPRRASSASRFQTPKPRILCAGYAATACFASRLYKPAGNSPARRKFPDHWPAPWSCAASRPVPPRSSAASSASGRTASARAFISPASACVCSSRRARAGASSAVKTP